MVEQSPQTLQKKLLYTLLFIAFLYLFLLSIQLMGNAFKYFGRGFAETLLTTTSNPFNGLFIGLLSTALVQSSSTTTSIVVGLVAGGGIMMHDAIPIVMGANMGTTVTNTMVSLGHIGRKDEFRRAFAASVVHDVFNVLAVIVLFPIQYFTGYLEYAAIFFEELLINMGGATFSSPLKAVTEPVAQYIADLLGKSAWLILLVALVLLFLGLRNMVKYMKALIMDKAEVVFERTIFKTYTHGLLFGILLTGLVQSSSVTTSLIVPLAGAGMLSIDKVLPYTMGANIGTTVTALMASLATGDPSAVAVAMSHLVFNVCAILIFWWVPFIPITVAEKIAGFTTRNRSYALFYIALVFFGLPLLLVYLMR
jgi:sodium-dependent phosphate cotransporter